MLIGIAGKAGSGKDTVGKYLAEEHAFVQHAFAGPLKHMLASIGIKEPAREDKEKIMPEWGFSYRRAAQLLGTEWGRALSSTLWVDMMEQTIIEDEFHDLSTVITDVRFENEAEMIRRRGGHIVHIVHIVGRSYETDNAEHKSEAGIMLHPNADSIIHNNGSLQALYAIVDCLVKELQEKQQN